MNSVNTLLNRGTISSFHFARRFSGYGIVGTSRSIWFACLHGENIEPHHNTRGVFSVIAALNTKRKSKYLANEVEFGFRRVILFFFFFFAKSF